MGRLFKCANRCNGWIRLDDQGNSSTTRTTPTHLFVQGGVGGLAAATVTGLYQYYEDRSPKVVIVEPDLAPCFFESAKNGQATNVEVREETLMAGLSCGEPSLLAWQIIKESVHDYMTIPEALVAPTMRLLANPGGSDIGIVAARVQLLV